MPEHLSRVHALAYGAVLAVVLVLGVRWMADAPSDGAPPPAITVTDTVAGAPAGAAGAPTPDTAAGAEQSGDGASTAGAPVTVHVAGAVRRPGLYRLPSGARLDDAIRHAGGPRRSADLSAVNLAAFAQDGRQVLLPPRAGRTGVAPPAAPQYGSPATAAGTAPSAPVDLNTATLEELDTLDGVGPATAQKILDYRAANGGFTTVDELDQVPGIGEKRMAALRERVTV